ncbi:MAG: GNAT family N-acetyltransferase [Ilumatobacteraceae bacterium]
MGDNDAYVVVALDAVETHPLRRAVLRNDMPGRPVVFDGDDRPGTVHLGVRAGDALVAISTWIPNSYGSQPAVQLRGMATAPELQGRGVGGILVDAGCRRAATIAPLVWARARDSALNFYMRHGFVVEGDGFIDETTKIPHHLIVKRLS